MTRTALILVAALLITGFLFAPRAPSADRVDPGELLGRLLDGSDRRDLVIGNYTPLVEGEDRIAGRDAWVLRLKPAVKRRPWRQLWVDKKSHEILAIRDWSHANVVRRSARQDGRRWGMPARRCEYVRLAVSAPWGLVELPTYIPSGFVLRDVGVRRDSVGCKRVVYSDGLFNISLFYSSSVARAKEPQQMRVVDCGRALAVAVPSGQGKVTVVADLPDSELARVANSIRRD